MVIGIVRKAVWPVGPALIELIASIEPSTLGIWRIVPDMCPVGLKYSSVPLSLMATEDSNSISYPCSMDQRPNMTLLLRRTRHEAATQDDLTMTLRFYTIGTTINTAWPDSHCKSYNNRTMLLTVSTPHAVARQDSYRYRSQVARYSHRKCPRCHGNFGIW